MPQNRPFPRLRFRLLFARAKAMDFDRIEQLKRQWTDKYVVADAARPELARFKGRTGKVKTVNMSGRALVQFDAEPNIAWFDIDLGFLKQVEAPPPKPAEEKPAKAAASKPAQPAAAPKPAAAATAAEGKKQSTADILAAARRPKGTSPAAGATAEAKPAAAPAKPASGGPAKPAGKLSTAEILASLRGGGAKGPAPAAPKPPAPEAAAPAAAEPETVVEQAAPAAVEEPAAKPAAGGKPQTTAEKIAWCRAHDAK